MQGNTCILYYFQIHSLWILIPSYTDRKNVKTDLIFLFVFWMLNPKLLVNRATLKEVLINHLKILQSFLYASFYFCWKHITLVFYDFTSRYFSEKRAK